MQVDPLVDSAEIKMLDDLSISKSALASFSQPAKDRLREAVTEYIEDLISECHRLEASMNSGNGPAEITQVMVNDAVTLKKRLPTRKRGGLWRVIVRVMASVLPLLVGLFFNAQKMSEGNNLVFFAFLLVLTAVVITISVIMEV